MNSFLKFICLASLAFGQNPYNDLIVMQNEIVNDAPVAIYPLSVTYSSASQQEAETDTTHYFVIEQCSNSHADLPYVQLNIICPDNPIFDTSGDNSFIVLELSNTKDKWDSTTIFQTNYIYSIQKPTIFNTIGWQFDQQPLKIYARYRAYGSSVPVTFLVSYSNSLSSNKGKYQKGYIPGEISTAVYYELSQYFRSSQLYYVNNNEHVVFNFSVCLASNVDPIHEYSLSILVVSDLSSPLSAFDLVACAISEYPDPNDCVFSNIDAVKNQAASPLVDVQISNDEYTDLSKGTYLTVYGMGGNADLSNKFLIDITIG